MSNTPQSPGGFILAVIAGIILFLTIVVLVYGFLGLLAAGLVSLIFHATGYESGMSFFQVWLVSAAAVALVGWVGRMFSGKPAIQVTKSE